MTQNDIWVLAWLLAGLYQTVARSLVTRAETGQDYSDLHMTIPFHEDYEYTGQRAGAPLPAEHVDIVEVRRAHDPSTGVAGRPATYSDESWEATTPNPQSHEDSHHSFSDDSSNTTRPRRRPRRRPRPRRRQRPHMDDRGDRERDRERERGREGERWLRQQRRRRRERQRRLSGGRHWGPRSQRRISPGPRGAQRPKKQPAAAGDDPAQTKGMRNEFLARVDKFRRDLFDQVMRMMRPASFPNARFLPASPLDVAARAAQTSTSTSSTPSVGPVEVRRVAEESLTEIPSYAAHRAFDSTNAQAPPRKNTFSVTPSTSRNMKDVVLSARSGLTTTTAKTVSALTTTVTPRKGTTAVQLLARALDMIDVNRHSPSSGQTKEGITQLQTAKPVTSKSAIEVRLDATIGDEKAKLVSPMTESSRSLKSKVPEVVFRSRDVEGQVNSQTGDVVAVSRAQNIQMPPYRGNPHNSAWNSTNDTAVARQMNSPINCPHKLA